MGTFQRKFDIENLIRELAENQVSVLEILREALSNAKDHGARRVWIRTSKDQRNEMTVIIADDGDGMNDERLSAFWGVGATSKPSKQHAIGYKGHGSKLYFNCQRLSVATRVSPAKPWRFVVLDDPTKYDGRDMHEEKQPDEAIMREIDEMGLGDSRGTVIRIERLLFDDRADLLSRARVESYCDWFTVIGDVRSGLFDERIQFHEAIASQNPLLEELRGDEGELRPIEVWLRINGERSYAPIGRGKSKKDQEFFSAWLDDVTQFADQPGLLAYGHRFADVFDSSGGATRVRDDTSAIRLTGPGDWYTDDGIGIILRVEGHRRQLQTYKEAKWQGHQGIYGFEQRFGLWLCRDFIPISQRNDILRTALDRAFNSDLQFGFSNLRNWKVFVNHQGFRLTANRNDVSKQESLEARVVDALATILERARKQDSFREWLGRLRKATTERRRDREIEQMQRRLEEVEKWIQAGAKRPAIELLDVQGLEELDSDHSLMLKIPSSEQELFYVYGLLSGRFKMPVHIIEYNTAEGVDAIGILRDKNLIQTNQAHVRVELKLEVSANNPIHHFFDAIDVLICWDVGRLGDIYEETSAGSGMLRKRAAPVLSPPLDTHEIAYQRESGDERVIPILRLSALFPDKKKSSRRR
ncbi:MAG: hypothetical protein HC927_07475 [Deltaproteobacteria bacterium]|nr:hypothetical protein [Deltaproteobacteria bacterium]